MDRISKPKLLIVDEHAIVRDGLATLFEAGDCAEVVGSAYDGYSAIKACRTLAPDIALLDMNVTRPSLIETFRRVKAARDETRFIVYSSEFRKADIYALLGAGAYGFIPKQAKASDYVNAVRCASLGYVCAPQDMMEVFLSCQANRTRTGNPYGLSPREIEVLEASISGEATKLIAHRLNISVRTVETHRNSIYRKTSCRCIESLGEIAAQMNIVAPAA